MKTSLSLCLTVAVILGLSACSKTEEGVYSPPSKAHEQPIFPPALEEKKPEASNKEATPETPETDATGAATTATPATEPTDV